MAVITIPDNLSCDAFSWGQSRNTINFKSPFGTQSVDVRSPWWTATLSAPVGYEKDAGNWQSLMMSLGGSTNQLAMHNLARPTPLGTLRGNMTFNSYAPVGATTININSQVGGINLLTFPEDFSNVAWGKVNSTVTPNTITSPDNTITSDTITSLATSTLTGIISTSTTVTNGSTYTISYYISKTSFRYIQLCFGGGASNSYANFDILTGTVAGGSYSNASITSVGNFYRVSMTFISIGVSAISYLIFVDSTSAGRASSFSGGVGISMYIWGAKLETGSIVTDYGYGKTLLKGDYIGFGSGVTQQVCMVVADSVSTSQGYMPVNIQPPLRNAFTQGSAITWDKPKVLFRQQESNNSWDYNSIMSSGYKMSLLEDPRP
jgi:hypothetical protein